MSPLYFAASWMENPLENSADIPTHFGSFTFIKASVPFFPRFVNNSRSYYRTQLNHSYWDIIPFERATLWQKIWDERRQKHPRMRSAASEQLWAKSLNCNCCYPKRDWDDCIWGSIQSFPQSKLTLGSPQWKTVFKRNGYSYKVIT